MAALFGNKLVLPIGCSCINQLQLKHSKRLMPSLPSAGFFDWAGTTPDSTVRILNQRAPFVENEADLELVKGRARSRVERGVYFWHINQFFRIPPSQKIPSLSAFPDGMRKFIDYHRHAMANLNDRVGEIHCLWSNIQPNLQHAAREVGEPWSNYFLTRERYLSITEACSRLRARKVAAWFVCREEDMDGSLAGQQDVIVLDVARSPTDFTGRIGLFDPVFERMGICREEQSDREGERQAG